MCQSFVNKLDFIVLLQRMITIAFAGHFTKTNNMTGLFLFDWHVVDEKGRGFSYLCCSFPS